MFGFGRNQSIPLPEPLHEDAIGDASSNNGKKDSNANKNNKTNSGFSFDSTALERAAKAAKDLEKSPHAKEAFVLAKESEKTKQMEHSSKMKENEAMVKAYEVQRVEKEYAEKRKLLGEQAEHDKRRSDYQDKLKRKQMTDQLAAEKYMKEHELKKREESLAKQEGLRRKTLEYEAKLREKTELARVRAEVEGNIKRERLNHDLHLDERRVEAKEFRETVLDGIKLAGSTIGNGIMTFLSDKETVTTTVVALSVISFGIYTAKTSTGVVGRYIESRLGKPSLVRETSRHSLTQVLTNPIPSLRRLLSKPVDPLKGIVLENKLDTRLRELAHSTYHTKQNRAPFRHVLLCGPPGTGKTLFAKALARHSGLEYAILTGGDVTPLGREGVTEIHKLFDWAVHSKGGLLLFVDEADAFLQKRNSVAMSEDMRNALNAFLYRTGEATDRFMVVLATNQPEQFDWAVNDRVDEIVEFTIPGENERRRMIDYYFEKYINHKGNKKAKAIVYDEDDVDKTTLEEIARKTEGFSGREISKLVIAWQAAAYGSANSILTKEMMHNVLEDHMEAHITKNVWKKTMSPIEKNSYMPLLDEKKFEEINHKCEEAM